MKMILLSDLHLINDNPIARLDNLTEVQWEKLDFIFSYARKENIRHILQAGDFTDTKRSWELLQKLADYFSPLRQKVKIYCVKGQHDSYYHDMENQKTTTGVLISSGLLTLLGPEPNVFVRDSGNSILIYGASFGEDIPKVGNKQTCNILVIHAPIGVMNTPHVEHVDAIRFMKKHKDFDLILCGDIHEKFLIENDKQIICNTGPLLRKEATEYIMSHLPCFYVYDTDSHKIKTVNIPVTDGKQVMSREHIDQRKERQDNFAAFVEKVREKSSGSSIDFSENLKMVMFKNKTSKDVRKIIDSYMAEERKDL